MQSNTFQRNDGQMSFRNEIIASTGCCSWTDLGTGEEGGEYGGGSYGQSTGGGYDGGSYGQSTGGGYDAGPEVLSPDDLPF